MPPRIYQHCTVVGCEETGGGTIAERAAARQGDGGTGGAGTGGAAAGGATASALDKYRTDYDSPDVSDSVLLARQRQEQLLVSSGRKAPVFPGRAMGGPSSGLTWVGEKGPELLDLPSGSYVHNNKDSQKMAGGITITIGSINASSEADGRKAARIIIDTVTRELQKRKLLAA